MKTLAKISAIAFAMCLFCYIAFALPIVTNAPNNVYTPKYVSGMAALQDATPAVAILSCPDGNDYTNTYAPVWYNTNYYTRVVTNKSYSAYSPLSWDTTLWPIADTNGVTYRYAIVTNPPTHVVMAIRPAFGQELSVIATVTTNTTLIPFVTTVTTNTTLIPFVATVTTSSTVRPAISTVTTNADGLFTAYTAVNVTNQTLEYTFLTSTNYSLAYTFKTSTNYSIAYTTVTVTNFTDKVTTTNSYNVRMSNVWINVDATTNGWRLLQ